MRTLAVEMIEPAGATLAGLEQVEQQNEQGHVGEDQHGCKNYCKHPAAELCTCTSHPLPSDSAEHTFTPWIATVETLPHERVRCGG